MNLKTLLILGLLAGPVLAAPKTDPLTAGEQRWSDAAHRIVQTLDNGQAADVYKLMSVPRKKDTPPAAFAHMLQQVRTSLGPVTSFSRVLKLDSPPIGGVLGFPSNETVGAEEKQYADKYYDTIWSLKTPKGGNNYLLMTFVAENNEPRILWLEYWGESIVTPEYQAVAKPMKARADAFLAKLLKDQREDIIDHDLSSQFLRRLPRDHMMSLLEDVRHHMGAVGGVLYVSGWVQHQPPGVTLVYRQKDTPPGKVPYEVLVRLEEEHGQQKIGDLGDEWDTGKKKPKH